MGWVATHNITSMDETMKLTDRQFQREVKDVGFDRVKALLRFEAAELNRHYFYYWGWVQLLLAVVVLLVLLDATSGNKFTLIAMVAILLMLTLQHFLVQPAVLELGRGLDFAASDQMPEERRAFRTYHTYFTALEVIKLGLLMVLGVRMMLHGSSGKRRRHSGGAGSALTEKLDLIDHAKDSKIDR
ncbi:MAG: DUF4149 domain-containing protein [Bryobacterales bacterium]|nr:DUF4149 domain-containing protein [Bryobacterales bacterium]